MPGFELATVAGALGDRARAAMVLELMGGDALPAGALARAAGVAPSTATAHLARLEAAGLVAVESRGRERRHRLAGHEVAEAVEALLLVSGEREVRSLRAADRRAAERAARSCYDHAAGRLGVALCDRLCALGALDPDSLGLRDPAPVAALGVEVGPLRAARRPLTRRCVDRTERRPHLAGSLGAAVLGALLARGWVVRRPGTRALRVTPAGRDGLGETLGLELHTAATRADPPA